MAGWNLKNGTITEYNISEDKIWALFNYVFSDASMKRNTYKFGLVKSFLDNVFNGKHCDEGVFYSYEELFERFAENYWNLVVKYGLHQMRKDGKSERSKIETILMEEVNSNPSLSLIEYTDLDSSTKKRISKNVTAECKKCVIGALYEDFDGTIYTFDLKGNGLILNSCIHNFMLKHKAELEKLNYYSWAKFLERINDDNVLVRVIDKLEYSTPHRQDLSIYREILRKEFEDNNCFYCNRKLDTVIHVDHFIPWSFIKKDKIWNFVLSCPSCNEKKSNRIPKKENIEIIEYRNELLKTVKNDIVISDFESYSDGLIDQIWTYAKRSGYKEF